MTWYQILSIPIVTIIFIFTMISLLDPHTAKRWMISGRHYLGFLNVYFQFHILLMHRKHLSPAKIKFYGNRLRFLKERIPYASWIIAKRLQWEVELIDAILLTSGRYTEKMTGKHNEKHQFKFFKKGERKQTTFQHGNGEKVKVTLK